MKEKPVGVIRAIDTLTNAEDRCEGLLLMAQGIENRSHSAALERVIGDVLKCVIGAKAFLEVEDDRGRDAHV